MTSCKKQKKVSKLEVMGKAQWIQRQLSHRNLPPELLMLMQIFPAYFFSVKHKCL